jgi:transposase-like protein
LPIAEKIRLVEATMQPGMSVSYVAWRAAVAPSLLFNRRRRMLEGGLQAIQADEDVVGTSQVRELERRVRELERLLGLSDGQPGAPVPKQKGESKRSLADSESMLNASDH